MLGWRWDRPVAVLPPIAVAAVAVSLLAFAEAGTVTAQPARPPAPGGDAPCYVWWQAPHHLGETVEVCGVPRDALQQDGLLVIFLGPQPSDLRVALPLALRETCPAAFEALENAPSLNRVRASGPLEATPEGPLLSVGSCDHLVVTPRTF